jgi:hypothetical protein
MKKSYLIIFAILLVSTVSFAKNKPETIKLNGTAFENTNGIEKPLAFAYVYIENSTTCTYTDCEGNFNLEVPKGKQKIKVSFKGLACSEKTITRKDTQKPIKLILNQTNIQLAEAK